MPTNYLMLVSDTVRMKTVYGDLQQDETSRARTPEAFLSVYDQLVNYRNDQAEKWLPDTVEVMLTRFDHSAEKPVAWPEGWPDLNDKTTVSINPNLYSVYIPKSEFDNLLKLLSSLSYRRAVEINGRKFSVTYRLPFPNLRLKIFGCYLTFTLSRYATRQRFLFEGGQVDRLDRCAN